MALFATVISLGVAVGQVVGGALVGADVAGSSRRPVFLVNVPIGLALLLAGRRYLPSTRARPGSRLDLWGVVLLTSAVLLVVVPLVFGRQAGWEWWTWTCLLAATPVVGVLVAHLVRVGARGGQPLVDLGLFRRPVVAVGLLSVCAQMVAYGGFLFAITLHLQQQLGYSPLRAGLVFGPYAIGFGAASLGVLRVSRADAHRISVIGLFAMSAGYGPLALVTRGGEWTSTLTVPLLAISGVGSGPGATIRDRFDHRRDPGAHRRLPCRPAPARRGQHRQGHRSSPRVERGE